MTFDDLPRAFPARYAHTRTHTCTPTRYVVDILLSPTTFLYLELSLDPLWKTKVLLRRQIWRRARRFFLPPAATAAVIDALCTSATNICYGDNVFAYNGRNSAVSFPCCRVSRTGNPKNAFLPRLVSRRIYVTSRKSVIRLSNLISIWCDDSFFYLLFFLLSFTLRTLAREHLVRCVSQVLRTHITARPARARISFARLFPGLSCASSASYEYPVLHFDVTVGILSNDHIFITLLLPAESVVFAFIPPRPSRITYFNLTFILLIAVGCLLSPPLRLRSLLLLAL